MHQILAGLANLATANFWQDFIDFSTVAVHVGYLQPKIIKLPWFVSI